MPESTRTFTMCSLLLVAALAVGCHAQPPVTPPVPPDIPRPTEITAHVQTMIARGKERDVKIEVRPADIDRLYALVKPVEWIEGGILKTDDSMIARLTFKYPDRPNIDLIVRSWGVNPAAVSLDDETYFSAALAERVDGGVEVLRLLIKHLKEE